MNFDIAPTGGGKPHRIYPVAHDPNATPPTAATAPATAVAAANAPSANPAPADPAATPSATAAPAAAAPSATAAPAASSATAGTPDSRATTFQAVEGGAETRSGETLMVEAYTAIWLLLMGWLVFLWRKQAGLNARLSDLEHAIDRAAAKSGTKAPAAVEARERGSARDESPSNV
jgi:CcmD family protein